MRQRCFGCRIFAFTFIYWLKLSIALKPLIPDSFLNMLPRNFYGALTMLHKRALTGTSFDQLAVFCLQNRQQCYLVKLVLIFFVKLESNMEEIHYASKEAQIRISLHEPGQTIENTTFIFSEAIKLVFAFQRKWKENPRNTF